MKPGNIAPSAGIDTEPFGIKPSLPHLIAALIHSVPRRPISVLSGFLRLGGLDFSRFSEASHFSLDNCFRLGDITPA